MRETKGKRMPIVMRISERMITCDVIIVIGSMSLVSKRRIRRSGNTEMALSLEAMFLSSQSFSINSYYPSNTPLNDNPTSAISCNRWRSSTSPPILKRPSLINKLIEPDRPLITSGKQFSAQCLSIT